MPDPGESLPRRWRVITVDDDPDTADSMALCLELAGCVVLPLYGAVDLAARAAAFRPDLVLLDIGMPGVNGFEAVTRLRAVPELAKTRFVALTGFGRSEDRQRGIAAGFDAYLVKPVDPEAVVRLLDDAAVTG
jgi:CheY-like chemotaxis protein